MATGGDGRVEFCSKTLRGRNRKCPVGGRGLVEVAKIRTGRFKSYLFGNLEKTRSGWPSDVSVETSCSASSVDGDRKVCIIRPDRCGRHE